MSGWEQRMRITVVFVVIFFAACSKKQETQPHPPPQVGVMTVHPQSVSLTTELPGRVVAYRVAEVRPQVNGVVQKRSFREGADVKSGQQLYQIDPAPFQASLESAQAALSRAQATATSTELLAQRYKPLSEARAVSKQDYDNAIASRDQSQADVASAKAALDTARINLAYTRVYAPIAGRTGRSSVTEGALVSANQAQSLLTISQLDPIYVDVTQSSTVLLRLKQALKSGLLKKAGDSQAETKLILEDGSAYPQAGKLQFSEVTVDPGTGSVTLRAEFSNPDGTLLPGMFVREKLEEGVNENALVISQRGVTHNPKGDATVMVVGADNKADVRAIKTERAVGDQWVVSEGLKPGDKIIVTGVQAVKPGDIVQPTEVTEQDLIKQQPLGPAAQTK
jgi:membrane fusion protein, multidrug efflux system